VNLEGGKPKADDRPLKSKRVPRWCGVHSSRPVARVWPLLTCSKASPCGAALRDLAWAPGSPPTG